MRQNQPHASSPSRRTCVEALFFLVGTADVYDNIGIDSLRDLQGTLGDISTRTRKLSPKQVYKCISFQKLNLSLTL